MVLRSAEDNAPGMLNVRDFGSKGDGITDDTTAIRQAAEAANQQRRTLFFPAGRYIVSSGGFDIDANRTGWWGDGAEIHLTHALPGGYLIRLFSTASYETARANNRAALYGLAITGGGLGPAREYPDTTAIMYGDDKHDTNSLFTTEHVSVDGFAYAIGFRGNVYMWQMEKCYIRGGRILVPAGLKNFGERMVVRDSVLADTTYQVTEFKSGYWFFENVSFDNIPIRIAGDAVAWFTGCHFENAGGHAPYRYLSIDIENGVPGEAHITSSNVVNNPPTDKEYWDQPLFWVHSDIRNDRGLHIQNVRMPNSNTYRSELSEGSRVLVGGGGRVNASGVTTFTQTGSQWVLSRYESLLVNPGFEEGVNGWTNTGSSGGQWAADGSRPRVGRQALRLTSTAGRIATAGQTFPVAPGRHVSANVWLRHVVQGRGALEVLLIWLDVAGNPIGHTGSLVSVTANTDWTLRTVMAPDPAPAGTTRATILFCTQAASGTVTSWVDEVLVTVL
jgi:hypothetical protein